MYLDVKKFGIVINQSSIPFNIPNDNINGPTVFKRPAFFQEGPKWIMYFAHHIGNGIRIAESENLIYGWKVRDETILDLKKIPGNGHIASPEIEVLSDRLNLYYHCNYNDDQYTFKASTYDGKNWEYDREIQGYFYFRIIEKDYAISKYKNNGGIWYKRQNGKFVPNGFILPKMRHCCYFNGKLYWSEIGDMPECIYRADLSLSNFVIKNIEKVITPTEYYEIKGNLAPSNSGSATNVTEVRDPFVIENESQTYIFYTVCGEEGIAIAEIL